MATRIKKIIFFDKNVKITKRLFHHLSIKLSNYYSVYKFPVHCSVLEPANITYFIGISWLS